MDVLRAVAAGMLTLVFVTFVFAVTHMVFCRGPYRLPKWAHPRGKRVVRPLPDDRFDQDAKP